MGPMGGAGVEDAAAVAGQFDGLDGRVVGQAEDRDIRFLEQPASGMRVLAGCRIDAQQFQIRPRLQPLDDLEAGRTGFAIDENPC